MVERPSPSVASSVRQLWWSNVSASIQHQNVVKQVRADAGWSTHFAFMTLLSAGIAILGMLLSSPAVVIGAMLISPLMGPIIGLGFALATFDSAELRRSAIALCGGFLLAVGFSAAIVALSPLQTLTDEIAARSRPNLFDLLVALFSGVAGTYAMIRGRHGAIVGVAIATALMPPLAAIGYGAATLHTHVLSGALLLFFTNLMTIAGAAAILARLYGFAPDLSPRQTGLQAALVAGCLAALAVPLAISLRQIAWEALAGNRARQEIQAYFGPEARISALNLDYDSEPLGVSATVLTPHYRPAAQADLVQALNRALSSPVDLGLDQIQTADGSAEEAELARAQGGADRQNGDEIASRLAMVAGVPKDDVLLDIGHRRARVTAAALPGAGIGSYRVLEQRVRSSSPGWNIELVPPAGALSTLTLNSIEIGPGTDWERSLADIAWAAARLDLGLVVSGPADERAAVAAYLAKSHVDVIEQGDGPDQRVELRWRIGEELRSAGG